MIAPQIHPSSACGPPIAPKISGIVMNGPTPTMFNMFEVRAGKNPMPRFSPALPNSVIGASTRLSAGYLPERSALTATSLKNTISLSLWFCRPM
jgi:hypothetical protein